MKTRVISFLLIITLLLNLSSCNIISKNKSSKLQIYTSCYLMNDFTLKIAGKNADVHCMMNNGVDPHDFEPTLRDKAVLETADMFVYNGAGLETWTKDVLSTTDNKDLTVVDSSKNVPLLNINGKPTASLKNDTNPHIWISPLNAKIQLKNIKDALVLKDKKNASFYEANYQKYAKMCDDLFSKFKSAFATRKRDYFVITHRGFNYLTNDFSLTEIAATGADGESEPAAATLANIIDLVNKDKIKIILSATAGEDKTCNTIASETGAKIEKVSTIESLTAAQIKNHDDYFSLMNGDLLAIKNALN